ncbi:MAG TPA: response regulator [Cyclobacteriaceae bacterium]|jgi:CheY-like chemotaxis protein
MRKILVIEDDTLLCWLLKKIVGTNAEVVLMHNGLEAWNWLSEGNEADLIISDIKMPALSGLELLKKLNGNPTLKDVPVIILSGFEDPSKRKACLDLGAYTYMVKPFEPAVLIRTVEQALNIKVSLQA